VSDRLFHLVLPGPWREADPTAPWAPPSLAEEGFLHFSFAHQLEGTLALHFRGVEEVWLLELDPESVADRLLLEPSRGGEDFPHLHRALGREEVLGWWSLRREGSGPLPLPDLAAPPPRRGAPPTALG
jgi:uncharacterized protein (DUF952 family)